MSMPWSSNGLARRLDAFCHREDIQSDNEGRFHRQPIANSLILHNGLIEVAWQSHCD